MLCSRISKPNYCSLKYFYFKNKKLNITLEKKLIKILKIKQNLLKRLKSEFLY